MRPASLDPLFGSIRRLKGIGPAQERLFARLLGQRGDAAPRIIDLLLHLPTRTVDRRDRPLLRDVRAGSLVTVTVTIDRHRPAPPRRGRAPHRVFAHDETGDLILTFFNARRPYLENLLPIGESRIVSGTVELFDGMLQMVHPDRIVGVEEQSALPSVEPVYPLTEGLTLSQVSRAVQAALAHVPRLPEWQEPTWIAARAWPSLIEALLQIHQPASPAQAEEEGPAWSRLAYDELLAGQLALALVRASLRRRRGRTHVGTGALQSRITAALPFTLTASQQTVLGEILADLGRSDRMLRLLQGDVGSGKTVVALLGAAAVVETGRQAALMAPTEVLARQHWRTIAPLAEAAGIRVALLTGRERGRERAGILDALRHGRIDVIIGTHALFQPEVAFKDLGLAIVDEQHRFGVQQRLALAAKGTAVDMLVMTATPIPRTLVLTYFGDMEVSELRGKPAGRQPIDTRAVALDRIEEIVDAVGRKIVEGAQVYWVCPLVSESEQIDLAAAAARFAELRKRFGESVALVHGQMAGQEKDAAMQRFASGSAKILVATTVIEVGIDVPQASIMIIEQAERFGLAQLHQLRGRVGRGDTQSSCILLYGNPLSETARARLAVMRETDDGFRIAEEDLRLRGEGDVLGTRQSGMPGFRIARLGVHAPLLEAARADAALALTRDPQLCTERGHALRHLLYLFEQDEAVRLIGAG